MSKRRKICFPVTSRAYYARVKLLLRLLHEHPDIDFQLILGGPMLLGRYGEKSLADVEASGFDIKEKLLNTIDGGDHVAMAKSAGLIMLETTNVFAKLDPEVVVICGDRSEQLAIAMAAVYLNKTIAHIEGGDVTGSIDESVRHAITKLAHIHFVTNDAAYKRVIQMGENPDYVFNVGSPDVEYAASQNLNSIDQAVSTRGVGHVIDLEKPFLMVMQHPVTSEDGNWEHIEATLKAVSSVGMQAIWFWPNNDAGTDGMSKILREFHEKNLSTNLIRFMIDVTPEDFIVLLKKTKCLVGNSSSGIKECSYLGTPVVNIGSRQDGRTRGENVIDAGYDAEALKSAIQKQIDHGVYESSPIYFKSNTSKKIVDILNSVDLYKQKKFYDIRQS